MPGHMHSLLSHATRAHILAKQITLSRWNIPSCHTASFVLLPCMPAHVHGRLWNITATCQLTYIASHGIHVKGMCVHACAHTWRPRMLVSIRVTAQKQESNIKGSFPLGVQNTNLIWVPYRVTLFDCWKPCSFGSAVEPLHVDTLTSHLEPL